MSMVQRLLFSYAQSRVGAVDTNKLLGNIHEGRIVNTKPDSEDGYDAILMMVVMVALGATSWLRW